MSDPKLIALNKLGEVRNENPMLYQVIQELQQQMNQYILDQAAAAGAGSVTSIALTAPTDLLTVGGSPITGSGTLALTKPTVAKNKVYAGPSSGADASPTFRIPVIADLPAEEYFSASAAAGTVITNGAPLAIGALITVASTGKYHVSFNAGVLGIAGQFLDVYYVLNGALPAYYSFRGLAEPAGQSLDVCGYEYMFLNAGDTLTLAVYHHGGGANTTTSACLLQVSRAH